MEEDAPARLVFNAGIYGSRRRGRPCIRWKDQIEKALSSIGVTNWLGAQEAEAPGRMCCGRPNSVNRVVMASYKPRNRAPKYSEDRMLASYVRGFWDDKNPNCLLTAGIY